MAGVINTRGNEGTSLSSMPPARIAELMKIAAGISERHQGAMVTIRTPHGDVSASSRNIKDFQPLSIDEARQIAGDVFSFTVGNVSYPAQELAA